MPADTAFGGTADAAGWLRKADAWQPELTRRAAEFEALRRLPQDIADRLATEGIYTMCNPPAEGGAGATPMVYAGVVEALARADASVAWCTFNAITSAYGMAFADKASIREMLAVPGVITAGVYAPMGRARPDERGGEAGYTVSGRWGWGSGAQNAHWVSAGCFLCDGEGKIVPDTDGRPQHLSAVFARDEIEFIDTWTVAGLQGTGSADFQAAAVFVPAGRITSGLGTARSDDPIFRFPAFGLLAMGIGATTLGLARGIMDDFHELAGTKVPAGSSSTLAAKSSTHRDIARAEAAIRQGRAFFHEAVEAAWAAALEGEVATALKRDLRLATSAAVQSSKLAVDLVYELAGGSAVYSHSPIQRRFRDMHVATQHMMVKQATYELTGRLFMNQPTDTSQL